MNAEELTEKIKRDGHSTETTLAVMFGICLLAMPIFAARPCCHSACRKYAVRHGYSSSYCHAHRHYHSYRYHAGSYCGCDPYSYYGVTFATPAVVVEEPVVVQQPVVVRPAVCCCSAIDAYRHHGLIGGTLRLVFGICFGDDHESVVAPAPAQVVAFTTRGEADTRPRQQDAQPTTKDPHQ